MKKKIILITVLLFSVFVLYGETNTANTKNVSTPNPELSRLFNEKLTTDEKDVISSGEILIKNIKFDSYMSLNKKYNPLTNKLWKIFKDLNPKYLAEIIQAKPYAGNEDLPEKLVSLLNNVPDYAGIPYYSERNETWYDLYESAIIKQTTDKENETEILADLVMEPFGIVEERINIYKDEQNETILYTSENLNTLSYFDKFDCVKPNRMKMCILLTRAGDQWILYGIGGVNAPRIPFFSERIETSFMNRIKTFCNFIFTKF